MFKGHGRESEKTNSGKEYLQIVQIRDLCICIQNYKELREQLLTIQQDDNPILKWAKI